MKDTFYAQYTSSLGHMVRERKREAEREKLESM